jgi:hypothetical protein
VNARVEATSVSARSCSEPAAAATLLPPTPRSAAGRARDALAVRSEDAQSCLDLTPVRWRSRHYHNQAGHASPMNHPIVKATLKGVRREIGVAQKGKSALTIDGLRPVVPGFGARRIDVGSRENSDYIAR